MYNLAKLRFRVEVRDRLEARRRWLWAAVLGSLTATFGTLTGFAVAFLLPAKRRARTQRVFLGFASSFAPGLSRVFELPSGDNLVVTCTASEQAKGELTFRGYSDRCPHLGCRVHYAAREDQYICPCHAGIFNADGEGISGPPAQAGQQLQSYRLERDGNSLYAAVNVG